MLNVVDSPEGAGQVLRGWPPLGEKHELSRSRNDAMMEYLRHTGSAIWACPPGVRADGWWGDTLFTEA
jgi:hypothetical protein